MIIYQYSCSHCSSVSPMPNFELLKEGDLYRSKLTLPLNAPFQIITGPAVGNSHASKKLVCLDACKKLHMMGALNDRLLPSSHKSSPKDSTLKVETKVKKAKGVTSGAGKYIQNQSAWCDLC